jgi:hypothetical protein
VPFILGLIGLVAAAYIWSMRARNAGAVAQDLAGMAGDVMNAARRFGFRRSAKMHPVESLEDTHVATAAIGIAFLELGSLPSNEEQDALIRSLQSNLQQSHESAQESVILGRWLINESGGPQQGIERLTRRLLKLGGNAAFQPLMAVLRDVAAASRSGVSQRQTEALQQIAVIFRIR